MTQYCARCRREAPPPESSDPRAWEDGQEANDYLFWEALDADGTEVICPGCITGQEQQLMDEQMMDEF